MRGRMLRGAWVSRLPMAAMGRQEHRRKGCTYTVTLGTRGAAGALGSGGATGTREARSTSNTRSTL